MSAQTVAGHGNWKRPSDPGMFGLGQTGTWVVGGGLLFALLLTGTAGPLPGVVVGGVIVVGVRLAAIRDKHGLSFLDRRKEKLLWRSAQASGQTMYRSGPLGRAKWGSYQLPGIAAGTALSEWYDAYERPFAMLHVRATGDVVAVLTSEPEGDSLVDGDQLDNWVAHWGDWLAHLSEIDGVQCGQIVIETSPDTSARLAHYLRSRISATASPFSQQVVGEVIESYPTSSSRVRGWAAVTFSMTRAGKKRPIEEMARVLAAQLPELCTSLEACGAGAVAPATAAELCEMVRTSYDPAAAVLFDKAAVDGHPVDLTWPNVGPSAADASWSEYRHDSGRSKSWTMSVAPRGIVQSSVLARLLAPHPDIARKRISLFYHAFDPATAAGLVDSDYKLAHSAAASAQSANARAARELRAAEQTSHEEATGAALLSFGIAMTATVMGDSDIDLAEAAMSNLSASSRLMIREAYGAQASTFAATLPLGLNLPRFVSLKQTAAKK